MNILKALIDAVLHREYSYPSDRKLSEAKSKAKAARDLTQEKIENIYAQLNGCVERGDKWFLVPNTSIDECGGGHDHD